MLTIRTARALGTAAVVLGISFSGSTALAGPASDPAACADYGKVMNAPRGSIPRDDASRLTRDPVAAWASRHASAAAAAADDDGTVTVPVAFHIITRDGRKGAVDDATVQAQIDVLNDAYAGTGFQFDLVETTRTASPQWFTMFYTQGGDPRFERGSHKEIKMKKALHQGDAETLNVYTAALGKRLLGWAYYPSSFVGDSALPRFFDGVVVDYRSLPGGAFRIYNEGDTLTHEVGHWLALAHTFANGCQEPGDFVEDTPYEASPQFYCDERDSCPDEPGNDPIHNFMDYTPDGCMFEFTDGQGERMRQAWEAFRQVA